MEFRNYQDGDLFTLVADTNLRAIVSEHPVDGRSSWTLVDNKIIGCGGFILMWPGVYEAWLYVDTYDNFIKYKICLIKKFRCEIENLVYHRLQATVDARTHNHAKFMNLLGFQPEATLQKYGYDGSDYIMYARLRECLH